MTAGASPARRARARQASAATGSRGASVRASSAWTRDAAASSAASSSSERRRRSAGRWPVGAAGMSPASARRSAAGIGVLARDGSQGGPGVAGLVPPQPELERGAERRLALDREPGDERGLAGQREAQRRVRLAAHPRVLGGLEQPQGLGAGALPDGAACGPLAADRVTEPGEIRRGPARGRQRGGHQGIERLRPGQRIGRAQAHLEVQERAGERPELRGASSGVEGGGGAVDLHLQVDGDEPVRERRARQADANPPAHEPELEAGGAGRGGPNGYGGLRHGGGILSWIAPSRGVARYFCCATSAGSRR